VLLTEKIERSDICFQNKQVVCTLLDKQKRKITIKREIQCIWMKKGNLEVSLPAALPKIGELLKKPLI
jgi:hypothetical protein